MHIVSFVWHAFILVTCNRLSVLATELTAVRLSRSRVRVGIRCFERTTAHVFIRHFVIVDRAAWLGERLRLVLLGVFLCLA